MSSPHASQDQSPSIGSPRFAATNPLNSTSNASRKVPAALKILVLIVAIVGLFVLIRPSALVSGLTGLVTFNSNNPATISIDNRAGITTVDNLLYGVNSGEGWGAPGTYYDSNGDNLVDTPSNYAQHRVEYSAAGVGVIRVDMRLDLIGNSDGTWKTGSGANNYNNITKHKMLVQQAATNSSFPKVLYIIDYMPSWLASNISQCSGATQTCPPASNAAFANTVVSFLNQVTQNGTYASGIAGVEVWNEPNLAYSWLGADSNRNDPLLCQDYNSMYLAAYSAIKAWNPSTPVLGPGVAGGSTSGPFINCFLSGVAGKYDYLSFHFYPDLTDGDAYPYLKSLISTYTQACSSNGKVCPIWVTEADYDDSSVQVGDPARYSFELTGMLQACMNDASAACRFVKYQWQEGSTYNSNRDGYPKDWDSISEPDAWLRKVGFDVYAAMSADHPSGSTVYSWTSTDSNIRALATRSPNGTYYVTVTSVDPTARALTLSFSNLTPTMAIDIDDGTLITASGSSVAVGDISLRQTRHLEILTASIPDTAPPTISITAPANNSVVSGTVALNATASDNVAVSSVQFYLNGVLSSTDNAAPYTMSWNTAGISNGTQENITAKATDTSGNSANTTIKLTVSVPDTTPPTATITAPTANQALVAGTTTTTLSVNTNEAATCKYSTTDVAYASMPSTFTVTGGTSHSTSITGLTNGQSYTRYVRCQDNAGNPMTTSQSVTFSVATAPDTTPPTITITAPFNNSIVSGTVAINATANDNVAVANVSFYLNGILSATDGSAPYTMSWNTAGISNGTQENITAKATDTSGNQANTTIKVTVTVPDTTPPTATITAPTANQVFAAGTTSTTLNVTTNEAATCKYSTTDVAYASMTNTFTTTGSTSHSTSITGLTSGQSYTRYVRCQDNAGNTMATSQSITFSVATAPDTTPPTIALIGPANNTNTTNTTITFSWTSSDNVAVASCNLTVNGTTTTHPANATTNRTLAAGTYNWNVTCSDTSGNKATQTRMLTINAGLPTVAITAPVNNSIVNSTTTINASASGGAGITGVQFYVDGVLNATDNAAPYTMSWNPAGMPNGTWVNITALATDAASNTANTTIRLLVSSPDTTQPTVSITSPANNSVVSGIVGIVAAASDNIAVANVSFYINGALQATDSAIPYILNFDTAALSNNTPLSIEAIATDTSGNSADTTIAVRTRDTTPPSTTLISPANGTNSTNSNITFSWTSSDNTAVASCNLTIDGATEATVQAQNGTMNATVAVSGGSHNWSVSCADTQGNAAATEVRTFSIAPPDSTPPTVSITAPTEGATLSGTSTIAATAADNVGVTGVRFYVDTTALGGEDIVPPYSTNWDTSTIANGDHVITAVAIDGADNTGNSSINVTISNAAQPSGGGSGGGGGGGGGGNSAGSAFAAPQDSGTQSTSTAQTLTFALGNADVGKVVVTYNGTNPDANATVTEADPANISGAVVYGTYSLDMQNLSAESIQKTEIGFKIPKDWLTAQNIDPQSVQLYALEGGTWTAVATTLTTAATDAIYFTSTATNVAQFALAGKKVGTGQGMVPGVFDNTQEPSPLLAGKPLSFSWIWVVGLTLLVGILIAVATTQQKAEEEKAFWVPARSAAELGIEGHLYDSLVLYVNTMLNQGKSMNDIKAGLEEVGWPQEFIQNLVEPSQENQALIQS